MNATTTDCVNTAAMMIRFESNWRREEDRERGMSSSTNGSECEGGKRALAHFCSVRSMPVQCVFVSSSLMAVSSTQQQHFDNHLVDAASSECLDLLLPRNTRNILAISSTESEMPQLVKTTSKPVIVMAPQEISSAHVAPPSASASSSNGDTSGSTEVARLLLGKLASNLK